MTEPFPLALSKGDGVSGWRLSLILLLVSGGLALPAVLAGWMNDDYFFATPLYETDIPFGYYDFMERFEEANLQPWWRSTDYKLKFFRPLSSLTLHLDFGLLGGHPLVAHLHSLLWSLILLIGGFALLRRIVPESSARISMVFFTFAICHAWGAGWIAARNAIVSGAFALWAAVFYLRGKTGGRLRDRIASALLYSGALLGGEIALTLPGFLLCSEIFETRDRVGVRLKRLLPVAAISLIFLIFYKIQGYGAAGSGAYLDPFSQPGSYLAGLPTKAFALIGSFSFGVPAMMRVIPGAESVPVVAGIFGASLLALGFVLSRSRLSTQERNNIVWLGLAVFVPMIPALAGIAQGREFVLSSVAFCALSAILVGALKGVQGRWYVRILPWSVVGLLFLGLLVINPISRLGQSLFMYQMSEAMRAAGEGSDIECNAGAPVYVINGDFMRSVGFPFAVARYQMIRPPSWQQLATPESDILVERTGPNRLVFSSDTKPLVNDFLDLYRPRGESYPAGQTVHSRYLSVKILETSPAGPTRVEFTIPELDEPGKTCLTRYRDGVLHTWTPPGVGESEVVEFVPPM